VLPVVACVVVGGACRGMWLNLCFDFPSLLNDFLHVSFASLDSISVRAHAQLRLIFTLKAPPRPTFPVGAKTSVPPGDVPHSLDFTTSETVSTGTMVVDATYLREQATRSTHGVSCASCPTSLSLLTCGVLLPMACRVMLVGVCVSFVLCVVLFRFRRSVGRDALHARCDPPRLVPWQL